MRSFCQLSLFFAGEEASQLLEATSYFAFFVSFFCGDSSFLWQISKTIFLHGWESVEQSYKVPGFHSYCFQFKIDLAEIPLERFRVTGKLRLEGTSGDHVVQLSLLNARSARLKWREEYQQENS